MGHGAANPQADAEESGWKMVAGDVFRAPKDPLLLCVQVGSGVQITTSAFVTLLFAALGAPRCPSPQKERAFFFLCIPTAAVATCAGLSACNCGHVGC